MLTITPEAQDIRALANATRLVRVTPRRFSGCATMKPLVISVVRNEYPRLSDFLSHYRRLGAGHFLFIDNGSTDGSVESLRSEPDVDLFEMHEPFSARAKHAWITRLIQEYGDRWYLLADADEHAVFHGATDLQGLTTIAEKSGRRRVRAALLDMYSAQPLAIDHRQPDQALLEAYPLFDPDGYLELREALLTSRTGGVRHRALSFVDPSFRPQLTKYPLFRLGENETIVSPHYIDPPIATEDPCWIALLHFKFDGDGPARISDAIQRGQYWRDSYEYRVYGEALKQFPSFSFASPQSRHYTGTSDLVDIGFIDVVRMPRWTHLLKRFFRRVGDGSSAP